MKKVFIVIGIVIVICITVVILKYNRVNKYNTNYTGNIVLGDKINVKGMRMIGNTKYFSMNLTLDNYKLANSDDSDTYIENDSDLTDFDKAIYISKSNGYLDNIIKKKKLTISYDELFDKYKINNELDLIKFYLENKKSNLLSSNDYSDMYNLSKIYTNELIGSGEVSYLNGSLNGYLVKENNSYTAFINNNDIYSIRFTSKEKSFSLDDIIEILNSIYFE